MTERVSRLNIFFDHYRSGDDYDREAITHVMACNDEATKTLTFTDNRTLTVTLLDECNKPR
jgi:hypothetical protein